MISFRLSAEEYEAYKVTCSRVGMRSLSELARVGLQQVFMGQHGSGINNRLNELRERIQHLALELERITEEVRKHDATGARLNGNHEEQI
ncbi:MAG TPA: hypothetical protein VFA04_16875 [Bryobacteraceae bacterium]|jgi:predicted ATPase|nr:hypothetical protein [Bryobacteraceae bacterium]